MKVSKQDGCSIFALPPKPDGHLKRIRPPYQTQSLEARATVLADDDVIVEDADRNWSFGLMSNIFDAGVSSGKPSIGQLHFCGLLSSEFIDECWQQNNLSERVLLIGFCKSHADATAVFGDELDAGCLEGAPYVVNCARPQLFAALKSCDRVWRNVGISSKVPDPPPECHARHLTLDGIHFVTPLRKWLEMFGISGYRIPVTKWSFKPFL